MYSFVRKPGGWILVLYCIPLLRRVSRQVIFSRCEFLPHKSPVFFGHTKKKISALQASMKWNFSLSSEENSKFVSLFLSVLRTRTYGTSVLFLDEKTLNLCGTVFTKRGSVSYVRTVRNVLSIHICVPYHDGSYHISPFSSDKTKKHWNEDGRRRG